MKILVLSLLFFGSIGMVRSQKYNHQDSLRGSIGKERAWWDVQKYSLSFEVSPSSKSIKGKNVIRYKVLSGQQEMQIDLQFPMKLVSVKQDGISLAVRDDGNAHFISVAKKQVVDSSYDLEIIFEGTPVRAKNPPWDGGFTWTKDKSGKDFVATSCQGIGASLWWPCKDHMSDEPDQGMLISVEVPQGLIAVSNGRLKSQSATATTSTFIWEVLNPICNYGVNINIGNYVNFKELYQGEKGPLDMDFWVLKENLEAAKIQFKDATRMMKAFEHWFGPYPFYEDSYKLVEVPYLGMEHQSSVTYGNKFKNGYLGSDLSGSGFGLKFDYIIIHESGHEWFANNITAKDNADLWIHESFTTYSEALFVEYYYGKPAGASYVKGMRTRIDDVETVPLVGQYGVNDSYSGNIYYKGSNVLHTLRQLVNSDEKWRSILRGLNQEFYHQTVTTEQIESYIARKSGLNLDSFFDQYLRDTRKPTLSYKLDKKNMLQFKWESCIPTFDMPIKIKFEDTILWIKPSTSWSSIKLNSKETIKDIVVDKSFYVNTHIVN